MTLSDKGLDFILSFEGKLKRLSDGRYAAYQCQAGVWTIYAGCTEGVHQGDVITEDEGRVLLRRELRKHEAAVNKAVTVTISQDQYDGLVSFSFNCGTGAMAKIAAVLNKQDAKAAAAKLLEYCKFTDPADKQRKVSRGLVRRRAAEARLLEPDDGPVHMPQKVDAPPTSMSISGAVAKVGSGALVVGEAARQIIPPIPPAITDTVTNVTAWKDTGGAALTLGRDLMAFWWISIPLLAFAAGYMIFVRGTANAEAE